MFPAGFELLYQPEVVRLYLSLLTESQNYNTLEAAAGALQNLSAGQWTVSSLPFCYAVVMLLMMQEQEEDSPSSHLLYHGCCQLFYNIAELYSIVMGYIVFFKFETIIDINEVDIEVLISLNTLFCLYLFQLMKQHSC